MGLRNIYTAQGVLNLTVAELAQYIYDVFSYYERDLHVKAIQASAHLEAQRAGEQEWTQKMRDDDYYGRSNCPYNVDRATEQCQEAGQRATIADAALKYIVRHFLERLPDQAGGGGI